MLNNPRPLFDFMKDGHNINFLETIIALVFFVRIADYDDRINTIFNLFDEDASGILDRKEASKLIQCSIYGLTRLAGLPSPSKLIVTEYISDLFKHIDEDGSGQVEYNELKNYVDDSMEIQNFILRYSGVQTIKRAMIIFEMEKKHWKQFFHKISIDYFGD